MSFRSTALSKGSGIVAILWMALGCAQAQEHPTSSADGSACAFTPPDSVHCGRTPTTAIDVDGRLWAVYVVGEHVRVAMSEDMGETWSRSVRVNDEPERVYTNGENRPKIAFGRNGETYVSWTRVTPGRFAGDIRFSRSVDGGMQFGPVRTVNDDGLATSHRFETLFTDSRGNIYLAWLDKRDQVRALEQGGAYDGAALYYTVSIDNGVDFAANRKVADHSCECCRVAMSETPDGNIAVFWRHIFGDSIRDHAFAILGTDQVIMPAQRPIDDNWRIEACPHHGPAMVTADDDGYHLAWFSLGDRKGIFYGRYDPAKGEVSGLRPIGEAGAGHPFLARSGMALMLIWKQFDGEMTRIMAIRSEDRGRTWTSGESVASTSGASDHPLLVQHDGRTWLSWHTQDEGLRLVPITESGDM